MKKLSERLGIGVERIIPFSAKARIGYEELWAAIKNAAGVADATNPENVERTGS